MNSHYLKMIITIMLHQHPAVLLSPFTSPVSPTLLASLLLNYKYMEGEGFRVGSQVSSSIQQRRHTNWASRRQRCRSLIHRVRGRKQAEGAESNRREKVSWGKDKNRIKEKSSVKLVAAGFSWQIVITTRPPSTLFQGGLNDSQR